MLIFTLGCIVGTIVSGAWIALRMHRKWRALQADNETRAARIEKALSLVQSVKAMQSMRWEYWYFDIEVGTPGMESTIRTIMN